MKGGQVAACDHTPAGWPDGTYTIIRRVKISVDKLRHWPREAAGWSVSKAAGGPRAGVSALGFAESRSGGLDLGPDNAAMHLVTVADGDDCEGAEKNF